MMKPEENLLELVVMQTDANVHMEFDDLTTSKASREVESRKYRPQLTMVNLILATTFWHEFIFISSDHCQGH